MDYGLNNRGASLRDALNAAYPLTGLGNYSTQFPPQAGAEMPSPPVPMPPPRPMQAPGPNYGVPLIQPSVQGQQGLGQMPGVGLRGQVPGPPQAMQPSAYPPRPPGAPPDYGAQLQYLARF